MDNLKELQRALPEQIKIYYVRYDAKPQYIYLELNRRNKIEGAIVDDSVKPQHRFEFYIDGMFDEEAIITDVHAIMSILKQYDGKHTMNLFSVEKLPTNSFYNIWIDGRYEIVGRMIKDFSS